MSVSGELKNIRAEVTHTHELGPETRAFLTELVDKFMAALQEPSYQQPPDGPIIHEPAVGKIDQDLAQKHEFRRYVKRMVARRMGWSAMCWCGWVSSTQHSEEDAYAKHSMHQDDALR